jgi:serine/threonine-protein kinase
VSSHFNGVGQPDASMSRDSYLGMMAAIGVGMPLFMVAIFYSIRYFPASVVNMPNRDYWLAPQRRFETSQTMFVYGLWFACAESLFLTLIHLQVVQANLAKPVRQTNLVWAELVVFLVFVAAWLVALFRTFRLPEEITEDTLP